MCVCVFLLVLVERSKFIDLTAIDAIPLDWFAMANRLITDFRKVHAPMPGPPTGRTSDAHDDGATDW